MMGGALVLPCSSPVLVKQRLQLLQLPFQGMPMYWCLTQLSQCGQGLSEAAFPDPFGEFFTSVRTSPLGLFVLPFPESGTGI